MTEHPLQLASSAFWRVVKVTLATVADSSARTYSQTYRLWHDWCHQAGHHPLDLRPMAVRNFLMSQAVTRSTRQRHLAALRKMARVLALDLQQPQYQTIYEALRLLRIPIAGLAGQERTRRALESDEVRLALRVWAGQDLRAQRNYALLAVLFFTGLRRSEVAVLRWEDVHLDEGLITVRHGKGDQRREVAIVDNQDDTAVRALRTWQQAQSAHGARHYVFCGVTRGEHLRADKPLHVRAINQIVEETSAHSGIAFTPHDARRTLGTDLLTSSYPVSDVQAQLGHQHASTTIQNYALPADARKRRKHFRTRY